MVSSLGLVFFYCLLGSDKHERQHQKDILTLTSLNILLGSDYYNGETPHFKAAKLQVWMRRQRTMMGVLALPQN